MSPLMQNKRGLIMGVANDHSSAWGIARTLSPKGASLAFTYQGEALARRAKPLAQSLVSTLRLRCHVENIAAVDAVFAAAGISDARQMFAFQARHSPLRPGVTLDEIGGAALYLLSDLSTGVTGDIHFVDSGYNIITMPQPDSLRNDQETGRNNGEQTI